jgi:hypothetical protein
VLECAGRVPEQATDVAAMDQTRRTFEAAAKLTDGVRERAVAHGPRPQPTASATAPTHTQQPVSTHVCEGQR